MWFLWQLFPSDLNLTFFIIFPFAFVMGIILFIVSSILISKIFLIIINLFHKPKEGVFTRNKNDKDYCYWCLRNLIKKWPAWLCRQFNLPPLEILALKVLGVKTSFSNALHEAWVDAEFIEMGKNVKLGQGSLISSFLFIKDKIIIKKISIGDNVVIGIHSVIMPGTIIESNTIIDSNSMTTIEQHLEEYSLYRGIPSIKLELKEDIMDENSLDMIIFKRSEEVKISKDFLSSESKEIKIPFLFYILSGLIIIGGSFILPGFLFVGYFFGFLIPYFLTIPLTVNFVFDFQIILIIFTIPIILMGIYLLHLFFIALITSWFYKYADKHGAVQGIFDRNLDETSREIDYYHVRSFLFKYPIFAITRSPFPWLLNWELNFFGSNKLGKGTVLEETFIHSHINFGKNCYLGTMAHMTNHLVDGVYGEENLTFFGIDIGNNSVLNALTGGLPGTEMGPDTTLLPMATTVKYDKLQGNAFYYDFPVRLVKNEKTKDLLGGEVDGQN